MGIKCESFRAVCRDAGPTIIISVIDKKGRTEQIINLRRDIQSFQEILLRSGFKELAPDDL